MWNSSTDLNENIDENNNYSYTNLPTDRTQDNTQIQSDSFVSYEYTESPVNQRNPQCNIQSVAIEKRLFLCEFESNNIDMIQNNAEYEFRRSTAAAQQMNFVSKMRKLETNMDPNKIYIYCHGTITNYGPSIGIYMGALNNLNRAEPLDNVLFPTNETVEVYAAITALRNLQRSNDFQDEPVVIRTRCKEIVDAFSDTSVPKEFSNNCLFIQLANLVYEFPNKPEFEQGYYGDPGMKAARLFSQLLENFDLYQIGKYDRERRLYRKDMTSYRRRY